MSALDLAVLGAYLVGTVCLGLMLARGQTSVRTYFTSGRKAPWGLVMASIVATETSTVTLISVPGFAFGANFTFLQLVFGYLVGRLLVSVFLLPGYFRGDYLTAYQVLAERFGSGVSRLAATVFLLTRNAADGFRLFATGLVLGTALLATPDVHAIASSLAPELAPDSLILVAAVLSLGALTILYTSLGGMTAVLWNDLLQLTIYMGGSTLAAILLFDLIPGGFSEIMATASEAGRLRLFDFTWSLDRSYTFWSGLIGGACLTVSTHGTDQLIVQRYLCTRSSTDASKALLWSGVVVLGQFLLFLAIGAMLYVYYSSYTPEALTGLSVDGRLETDLLFPTFIITVLPAGLRGLLVAAIVAAAMSTLSSSLNASASSTLADFYLPATGARRTPAHYLRVAKWATVGWGLVQIAVAVVAIRLSTRVVDEVLGISSFTNGLILGTFLLGLAGFRRDRTAYAGLLVGAAVMLGVRLCTNISWQWYVLIGATVTLAAGSFAHVFFNNLRRAPDDDR